MDHNGDLMIVKLADKEWSCEIGQMTHLALTQLQLISTDESCSHLMAVLLRTASPHKVQ